MKPRDVVMLKPSCSGHEARRRGSVSSSFSYCQASNKGVRLKWQQYAKAHTNSKQADCVSQNVWLGEIRLIFTTW